MLLVLKNKETLKLDSFSFKCCVGKKGLIKRAKKFLIAIDKCDLV